MHKTERLEDQWHTCDLPVLIEAARRIDQDGDAGAHAIAAELPSINLQGAIKALEALHQTYLDVRFNRGNDRTLSVSAACSRSSMGASAAASSSGHSPVACRPRSVSATTCSATDEGDASALRKTGRELKSVPGNIIGDIAAAFIRQQAGL